MAHYQDNYGTRRFNMAQTQNREFGSWLLAGSVVLLMLIIGLVLLNGLMDDTAATEIFSPPISEAEIAPVAASE